jgi:hypothetical protein
MDAMNKTRTLLFASTLAAAMLFGGVVGATVLANSTAANAASPSPSPSPGVFKPNENASHESGETAAHETAENNGTFHPGGPGGGPSNETSTHETTESAARESAEKT